jgi:hypothetical protein
MVGLRDSTPVTSLSVEGLNLKTTPDFGRALTATAFQIKSADFGLGALIYYGS